MHDYSIDRHPKQKILFFLAFFSILIAPIIDGCIQNLVEMLKANNIWASAPVTAIPVFALFGGLYWLFNRHLWKVSAFRKVFLVPDLNGTWECTGHTTQKSGVLTDVDWNGSITITQSWSQILIYLQTKSSQSKSISASIYYDEGVGYRLLYQYVNDPDADQLDLSKHTGATEVVIDLNCDSGKGYYFTDQHRNTVGTLKIKKDNHANSTE